MKKRAIVYSLFGFGKQRNESSFEFANYLRGLLINIRLNRMLFPGWEIVLETDVDTNNEFKSLFDQLPIVVEVNNEAPLTLAMLWRLKPIYHDAIGGFKYSHILCRDLDSPPTYREAQAVKYWLNRDKTMHAITDSLSHNVPLMGGMIGAIPEYFVIRTGAHSWQELVGRSNLDWAII